MSYKKHTSDIPKTYLKFCVGRAREVQAEVNFLWLLFYKRATSLLVLLRYPVTPSINKAFLLLLL